jgi:hypothetical protein
LRRETDSVGDVMERRGISEIGEGRTAGAGVGSLGAPTRVVPSSSGRIRPELLGEGMRAPGDEVRAGGGAAGDEIRLLGDEMRRSCSGMGVAVKMSSAP